MGYFVLTATLTNAGKSLIDSRKAANSSVTIDRISFGDATAAVGAGTISIGNLIESSEFCTQGTNLAKTSAEFQCLFKGQPVDKAGTIGVYSESTLVAAVRFTVPNNNTSNTQVAIRLSYANVSVFASEANTVPASLLADTFKKAYDDSQDYVKNGTAVGGRAFFGTGDDKEADWFCGFVNIITSVEEFSTTLIFGAANGTEAYYTLDNKRYMVVNGAWQVQPTGSMTDVVKAGRLYRSEITKSLFYARTPTNLLKVFEDPSVKAPDMVIALDPTIESRDITMYSQGSNVRYYYDTDLTLREPASAEFLTAPVGAKFLYVKFTPQASANDMFVLADNDVITEIVDWSGCPVGMMSFTQSRRLKKCPTNFLPPSIVYMQSMFYGCLEFDVPELNWDTSRVTDMSYCFALCYKFNGKLPWDTSNVTNFTAMFNNASVFNQPLDAWNVRNGSSFRAMFAFTDAFNKTLDSWRPGENLPARSVDISGMFFNARNFSGLIGHWSHNRFSTVTQLFYNAISFRENLYHWQLPADLPRDYYDIGTVGWIDSMKPRFIL